jgi:hypothetical protein
MGGIMRKSSRAGAAVLTMLARFSAEVRVVNGAPTAVAVSDAIDEIAGREPSLWGAEAYDQAYDATLGPIEEAGIEQVDITQDSEEFERWQEVGEQVLDEWIAEREAEGVPGQEMVDRLLEIGEG